MGREEAQQGTGGGAAGDRPGGGGQEHQRSARRSRDVLPPWRRQTLWPHCQTLWPRCGRAATRYGRAAPALLPPHNRGRPAGRCDTVPFLPPTTSGPCRRPLAFPARPAVEIGNYGVTPNYFEQNQAEALDLDLNVIETLVR